MHKLTDVYLARLQQRLARRLEPSLVEEHVREVRLHLYESIREQSADGIDEQAATLGALRRLGSDRLLAENLIRAETRIGDRSVWQLAALPALLMLAAGVLSLLVTEIGALPVWYFDVYRAVGLLSAFSFAWLCWRSRRILLVPMVAVLAAFLTLSIGQLVASSPLGLTARSADMRQQTLRRIEREISSIRSDISKAERTASGGPLYRDPKSRRIIAPNASTATHTSMGMLDPIGRDVTTRPVIDRMELTDADEARRRWKAHGTAYILKLQSNLEEQRTLHAYWQSARFDAGLAGQVLRNLGWLLVQHLLVLAAFNAAVLAARYGYQRLIELRWRPEQLA